MKNLPESRLWTDIRWRLRRYSEEPDDLWEKISPSISAQNDRRIDSAGHAFTFLALSMFLFLLTYADKADVVKGHRTLSGGGVRTESSLSSKISEGEKTTGRIPPSHDGQASGSSELLRSPMSVAPSKVIPSTDAVDQMYFDYDKKVIAVKAFSLSTHYSGTERDSLARADEVTLDPEGLIPLVEKDTLFPQKSFENMDAGQTTGSGKKKKNKKALNPMVYFSVTPTLSYSKVLPNTADDVMITGINQGNIFSSRRKGIEVEMGFQKRLWRKVELFGGINYSLFHQSISYQYLSAELGEIVGSLRNNYELYPSASTEESVYSFRQAGVSAGILYQLKGGRLSHKLAAGIQYVTGSVTRSSEGLTEKANLNFFNYMLMYRMQYSINQRLDCYIQPGLNYSLNANQFVDQPFEIKPYRVGIGIGVIYRF